MEMESSRYKVKKISHVFAQGKKYKLPKAVWVYFEEGASRDEAVREISRQMVDEFKWEVTDNGK